MIYNENILLAMAGEYEMEYGKTSKQSLSAIVRAIVALEAEGAEAFFGEPAVDIADWMKTDISGKGEISILDCQKLITSPKMYAVFMMSSTGKKAESGRRSKSFKGTRQESTG